MAGHVERVWNPQDVGYNLPRRARRPCAYLPYVPDLLTNRSFLLASAVYADVSDAEDAIRRLNAESPRLASLEAIARLLLRAEAVASSKIEHLQVSAHRLAEEEVARALDLHSDATARAILANIEALRFGITGLIEKSPLTVHDLFRLHLVLMQGSDHPEWGGVIRTTQNWIGGNDYNPCGASYVPPPPEEVSVLLDDLVAYLNTDTDAPLVQAAVAHAQFETIHPFNDGNGRTGRALIHIILRRRGLAPRYIPPISLVLATRAHSYIDGLESFRYLGSPTSEAARAGLENWIGHFAAATTYSCAAAGAFEQQIDQLVASWRQQAAPIRRNSAIDLLLAALPSAPLITATTAASLIGRSINRTTEAINRLAEAGVLRQRTLRRWGRAYEAVGLLDTLTSFERSLASPRGDTRTHPPVRPVPSPVSRSSET